MMSSIEQILSSMICIKLEVSANKGGLWREAHRRYRREGGRLLSQRSGAENLARDNRHLLCDAPQRLWFNPCAARCALHNDPSHFAETT